MTPPVRLASVGLGWWGAMLAEAAQRSGTAQIATCYARSRASREDFAQRFGCRAAGSLDEALSDAEVDGVLVATPHSTHLEIISAAAAAGKHVFVEKPLTLGVAEGRRAIAAAEAAGVVLQVGHHRRRQAATRRLRALVDDGALGTPHLLEAHLSLPSNLEPISGWRADPAEAPLGGMTGLGVHMIDNLVYLAGPAARVTAFSKPLHGRTGLDDVTVLAIEFERGPLGLLATSVVVPKTAVTAVWGTAGAAWSEEEGQRLFRQDTGETSRREVAVEQNDALAEQVGEFATCVRTQGRPEIGGPEALEVVAVLEAAVRSHARGEGTDVRAVRDGAG